MLISKEERQQLKIKLVALNAYSKAYMINKYIDTIEEEFVHAHNSGYEVFYIWSEYKNTKHIKNACDVLKLRYKDHIIDFNIEDVVYYSEGKSFVFTIRIVE